MRSSTQGKVLGYTSELGLFYADPTHRIIEAGKGLVHDLDPFSTACPFLGQSAWN